jgi:hypothetical protein
LCSPTAAQLPDRTRIVRVVSEARGQPAMSGSLDITGWTSVSAIKWATVRDLGAQLF